MHRLVVPVLALLTALVAVANEYDKLGPFERTEVDHVLKDTGLVIVADPTGKTIGRIIVVNREVFTTDDGRFLQWFNLFHRVTREQVIEREVLLRPGMIWDQDLLDESVRRVRNPILSNMVAILPVEASDPHTVDLLVVTRDLWSLRLNTSFQFQEDALTQLSLSIAENNFLGLRKQLATTFSMSQGAFRVGPSYSDPNIAGTRMTLGLSAGAYFARGTGEFEGTAASVSLAYPLWSLARRWGGSLTFSHYDSNVRFFRGGRLAAYDAPETAEDDQVPWRYHYRSFEVQATAAHQWGSYLKKRLSFGWELFSTDPEVMARFPFDAVVRAAFERDVLPRGELSSGPFVSLRLYTPRYRTYRDLRTFGLREDYRLGPELSYSIKRAATIFGSNADYTALSTSAQYVFVPMDDAYVKLNAGWSARIQDGRTIDQRVGVSFWAASPILASAFRVVARAGYSGRFDETANRFFTLGGESGLRGHALGDFAGEHRLRANLELRTRALSWYFFRVGGVVFYDMGHAADAVEDLIPVHDVGLGARILIPQINPYVIRLDWAFATQGDEAGFPGRFSAGFFQSF